MEYKKDKIKIVIEDDVSIESYTENFLVLMLDMLEESLFSPQIQLQMLSRFYSGKDIKEALLNRDDNEKTQMLEELKRMAEKTKNKVNISGPMSNKFNNENDEDPLNNPNMTVEEILSKLGIKNPEENDEDDEDEE